MSTAQHPSCGLSLLRKVHLSGEPHQSQHSQVSVPPHHRRNEGGHEQEEDPVSPQDHSRFEDLRKFDEIFKKKFQRPAFKTWTI